MATVTKLTPTGIHYSNEIDEVTFNLNSGVKKNLIWYSNNLGNISYWSGYCGRPLAGYNGDTTNFSYNVTEVAAPDGTFTATKFVTGNVQACGVGTSWGLLTTTTGIFTANTTYTCSIWAKVKEGTAQLDFGLNDYYASYGNQLTTEWKRFTYTATPNGAVNTLDRGIQFICTTKNVTVYVWGPQTEIGSQATIYEPTGANGIPLLGPAKRVDSNGKIYIAGSFDEVTYNPNSGITTNLVINSQTFTGTDWSKINASISSNTELAPDGSSTASFYKENYSKTFDAHQFYKGINPLANNTFYVLSCYYKPTANRYLISPGLGNAAFGGLDRTATFNLKTLTVTSVSPYITNYGITNIGNGWYRCFITLQSTSAGFATIGLFTLLGIENVLDGYSGDGSSGIYVWGAQLEVGDGPLATPSIYVPTTSSIVPNVSYKKRVSTNGNIYITGNYDEYTGIVSTTDGLVINVDAAVSASYPGTGTFWYDTSGNSGYNANYWNVSNQSTFNANNSFNLSNTAFQGFSFGGTLPKTETPTFSIEFWLKNTSFNNNSQFGNLICVKEIYQINGFRFGVVTPSGSSSDTTGVPYFWTNQSGGTIGPPSPGVYPITLNRWYQTVVTYDGNTSKIYFNGVLLYSGAGKYNISTDTFTTPLGTNYTTGLVLGSNSQGNQSMSGQISSFKWYNRALSPVEVYDNFNGLRTRFGI